MYLLGRFECVKVQDILIARSGQVFVDGIELDQARAGSTDLARRVPAPLQELTAAQSERILEFCQGPQDVAWVAKWFRVSEATILAVIENGRRSSIAKAAASGEFA